MYPSSFLKSPSNEVNKYSSDMSPRPSNGRDKINNYTSIPSKLSWLYEMGQESVKKLFKIILAITKFTTPLNHNQTTL